MPHLALSSSKIYHYQFHLNKSNNIIIIIINNLIQEVTKYQNLSYLPSIFQEGKKILFNNIKYNNIFLQSSQEGKKILLFNNIKYNNIFLQSSFFPSIFFLPSIFPSIFPREEENIKNKSISSQEKKKILLLFNNNNY